MTHGYGWDMIRMTKVMHGYKKNFVDAHYTKQHSYVMHWYGWDIMRKISPLERCFYPLCELFAFVYAISPAIYVSDKLLLVLFTFLWLFFTDPHFLEAWDKDMFDTKIWRDHPATEINSANKLMKMLNNYLKPCHREPIRWRVGVNQPHYHHNPMVPMQHGWAFRRVVWGRDLCIYNGIAGFCFPHSQW